MRLRGLPSAPAAPPETPGETPGLPPAWRRLVRVPRLRDLRDGLRRNRGLKAISLVLAFFLWYSINVTERDAERTVDLPVTIRKLPQGLIVTNPPAKPVAVTLRGPRTILDGVDQTRARLSVDLTNVGPGDTRVDLNGDMIRPELPRRLKVVRLEPPRMKTHVEPLVHRRLPVKADLAGTPALGYTVAESHVTPEQVEVTGPANKVNDLKEITTDQVDLRGLSESLQRTDVALYWAGDFVTFVPDHVTVTVTFEETIVVREFKHVDVRVLNAEDTPADVSPSWIDVTLRGPQRLLHNFKLGDNAVFVDADDLPTGSHKLAPRVDVPAAVEVTRKQPEVVTLQLGARKGRPEAK
jgi:YbbR domain-containing protein